MLEQQWVATMRAVYIVAKHVPMFIIAAQQWPL
jgi:hypothetical protein